MTRIVSTVPAAFGGALEKALRDALTDHGGDLQVSITPAIDPEHAEIIITERGGRQRAAYFAALGASTEEHVRKIRQVLLAAAGANELNDEIEGDVGQARLREVQVRSGLE